jgi:type I restriction enzyme S subunit
MTSEELTPETVAEWRTVPAGDVGRFRGGSGFPLRFQGQASGEVPFFKVSDMNLPGNGKYMTRANHYISDAVRKQLGATLFPAGSIVFAKVGAAVFLERKRILAQPSCIDNNMAAFVLDPSRAEIGFVHQLLLNTRLGDLVSATALPALNGADLASMPIALPALASQREITAVLERVDALVVKLDRLVAKRCDLKQAAMQSLLSGRVRLPGFVGAWGERPFAKVLSRVNAKRHQIQTSEYLEVGTFPVVDQGQKAVVAYSDRADKVFKCPSGGVIVFGDHTCIIKYVDFNFVVGADGTQLLSAKTDVLPRFVAYQLQSSGIESTGYNRHFKFLAARWFNLPGFEEQEAIVRVLSDMDAEIAILEARREKARQLKQGMMQALLTGRIRLV